MEHRPNQVYQRLVKEVWHKSNKSNENPHGIIYSTRLYKDKQGKIANIIMYRGMIGSLK